MATKRILNPVTGKYYKIRERNTSNGTKGQILGLWKQSTIKKKKNK